MKYRAASQHLAFLTPNVKCWEAVPILHLRCKEEWQGRNQKRQVKEC